MAGYDRLMIPRSYNDKTTNDKMDYYLEGAEAAALLAESWAIGGTSSRDGEDSDNASYYAELAKQYAEAAEEGNSSTSSNVEAAAASAEAAAASAEAAATSESSADEYATLAQSYAIGGTGTRTGEDADNAKYYSEQAADSAESAETDAATAANKAQSAADYALLSQSWAIGGTGTSLRDDGDDEDTNNASYYADLAAASVTEATEQAESAAESAAAASTLADDAAASSTLAESWAVGGTSTRDGEDEDNAKYYAEQAAQGGAALHTSVGAENNPVYFDSDGQAVKCISDEYYNTFLGIDAGATLISSIDEYLDDETSTAYCRYNTAVGYQALTANTEGNYNTAVGSAALYNSTEGDYNVAVGTWALYYSTEGNYNTAVGHQALFNNTEGNRNTAVGYGAGFRITTGDCNTAVGYHALCNYGQNNGSGIYRGVNVTTGSYNIGIGAEPCPGNETESAALATWTGAYVASSSRNFQIAIGFIKGLYFGYGETVATVCSVVDDFILSGYDSGAIGAYGKSNITRICNDSGTITFYDNDGNSVLSGTTASTSDKLVYGLFIVFVNRKYHY